MSRRILVPVLAAAALLLVSGGVLAGVLLVGGSSSDSAADGPAYLGASLQTLPFDIANVVTGIEKDSPAAKAGLTFGDSIQKLDGQQVKTSDDVDRLIEAKKAGDKVSLEFWHLGETKTAEVKLANAPKDPTLTKAGEIEFGSVKSASDKSVRIALALSSKEVTYEVIKATRFWRDLQPIKASELKEGDAVMVISVDGGKSALTGLAYSP